MLKLSHPEYFLPTVHALEPGKVLSSGTTEPQLIRGVCVQTGKKSDYVVKYIRAQRMSPEASGRELIAALIARELDFNVPEPVIINISDEFVELMRGKDNFQVASNSLGFNFGNEYKTGYYPVLKDQPLNESMILKLANLYALDIFISNADRRMEKPNFLTNGDDILVFDHELAFGFALELSFLRNREPWLIRDTDRVWINDNFCYNRMRGNQFDFSTFTNKFSSINDLFWNKLETILPAEWLNEQFFTIKTYLNTLIGEADLFSTELNRILL
ncbi:HipA family kinase [Mucilaginibacter pocheonensis]|uniref:HipA-like kinase domain-containing protein n=1 Tax=Mucilaginibacter pocheonensis TaxID=398050 RepID=A0ABU1T8F9_9SPHI|nr:HipA family kinase [Mucilaginibacter pocheonensis]MDR6941692.1 hypothetical protein [Mucilaginibacter pocheonensis]